MLPTANSVNSQQKPTATRTQQHNSQIQMKQQQLTANSYSKNANKPIKPIS
jgi:hypothetical protein